MKRFAFIDMHKKMYNIEALCRVMQVSSGGFRMWRTRPMSQRQRDDMVLLANIREQLRVSDLLCMSNLVHASATKEHDNDDNFQGLIRPTS